MIQFGAPQPPPFRLIGKDIAMLESYPSYYWVVGSFIHPLRLIRKDSSTDAKLEILASAMHGCTIFLRYESTKEIADMFPRSFEKARVLHTQVSGWARAIANGEPTTSMGADIEILRKTHASFANSFQDEFDRLKTFTVMPKGNLSVVRLVEGAASGYPKRVLECIDSFVIDEINHAGKCLAFELPTACGFHILRAVETTMKAYLHAATGQLPPLKNRNWGEYIERLNKAGAHQDVIDICRILKAKRNPLMHPTDNLDTDEAIGLLCVCQSGIEVLIDDVRRKAIEVKFKESLALMPTL